MLVLGKLLGTAREAANSCGRDRLSSRERRLSVHMDYRKVNRLDEREKFENSL